MMRSPEEIRPDLAGDGYDSEKLLTADEVGRWLNVPKKRVYELPIRRVRVGPRTVRYRPADVREFTELRVQDP